MTRVWFVATSVAMAVAPVQLYPQATDRVALTLFGGAGVTMSLTQPGIDRASGPAVVGGLELARPSLSGLSGRLALRLEGGFASQKLEVDQGVVSGDVQTVHAALAMRVALVDGDDRTLMPYALAGAAWARPSTRFELNADPETTPGAGFQQITHESVPGAIAGAGVAWQMRRAQLRAEMRWMILGTSESTSSTLPLTITVAVPLRR